MKQLLIVDIQQSFQNSEHLDKPVLDLSKQYENVVYCYDVLNGDGIFPYDMFNHMAVSFEEGVFTPLVIEKKYGFLRNLMDKGAEDSLIIDLVQLMLKKNIKTTKTFYESEDLFEEFKKVFEINKSSHKDFDLENKCIYVDDIFFSLKENIITNVDVVGGGINSCLKEIILSLEILEINYNVLNNYTY